MTPDEQTRAQSSDGRAGGPASSAWRSKAFWLVVAFLCGWFVGQGRVSVPVAPPSVVAAARAQAAPPPPPRWLQAIRASSNPTP